jgi:hypothetical protein
LTDIAIHLQAAIAGSYEMVDILQKARHLTSGSRRVSMNIRRLQNYKAILDTTSATERGNVSGIEQTRGSK